MNSPQRYKIFCICSGLALVTQGLEGTFASGYWGGGTGDVLKTSTSRWEVEELSWLESRAGRRGGDPDKQSVERKYPGLALELRERLACALRTQQGESWGGGGAKPKNSRW